MYSIHPLAFSLSAQFPQIAMTLRFKYQRLSDFIIVEKPYGLSSHAVDYAKPGAAEIFSEAVRLQELPSDNDMQLKVIHRLDSTTTGVLILGCTKASTASACEAFAQGQAQKKYLFITDKKLECSTPIVHHSFIEKQQGKWVSKLIESESITSANSNTIFIKLESHEKWSLWEAVPTTGKTHQIRLHAKDLGISILGDELYGGSRFPQIMLHAYELQLPDLPLFTSPPSLLMENLSMCSNHTVASWILAIERRNRLFAYEAEDCLRMIHTEGGALRADRMGETLCIYWYDDTPPASWALEGFEQLTELARCKRYFLYSRSKEGREADDIPEQWIAIENGIDFEFRKGHGISPGLFLDQRQQRARVLQHSEGKSILNLFCYSCGFSVAAAKGGATSVTSVDVSKSALEWGKQNLAINALNPENYSFSALDSRDYLRICRKQGRTFDIIICDPPSFSHGKKKVFSLERELKNLILDCIAVTAAGGEIYFSCNHERIDTSSMLDILTSLAPKPEWSIELVPSSLDYELPGQEPLLKSFIMKKR
jgi:23S rRNA (cytosine1962-C5)-methyltransferase